MKTGIFMGSALFVAAVFIGVVQLWFTPWAPDIFLKIELTVGAGFLIDIVICFVIRELKENKSNRDGNRLD